MESLWRMHRHWRKAGRGITPYQALVYIYIVYDAGLTAYHIHDTRLLDEHEKLHMAKQA